LVPFGQGVSGEKICSTLANQKQELLLAAIFVGQTERNEETQIWLPRAILVSDWLMLSKSSPLKLVSQYSKHVIDGP
jgi:flagellar biosynthesis protein FliQ